MAGNAAGSDPVRHDADAATRLLASFSRIRSTRPDHVLYEQLKRDINRLSVTPEQYQSLCRAAAKAAGV